MVSSLSESEDNVFAICKARAPSKHVDCDSSLSIMKVHDNEQICGELDNSDADPDDDALCYDSSSDGAKKRLRGLPKQRGQRLRTR